MAASIFPESDRAAGRGVGMSVVRNAVQQLAGTLSLASTPGRGTRFSIELPLTLAITDALITRVGQQLFAAEATSADATDALKPKLGPRAVTIVQSHDYLRTHEAPDYWALSPYYVPQMTGSACVSTEAIRCSSRTHSVSMRVRRAL